MVVRNKKPWKTANLDASNVEYMPYTSPVRFYFTRSARHHKIGRAHALAAPANAGPPSIDGNRLEWIASDDRGVELHIVGKIADENLVVIRHVMPTDLRS